MQRNHRGIKWLMALVSLVVFMGLGASLTSAHAATIDGSLYVTAAKVVNGPDFKPAETINVEYHLEFGNVALHSGDEITIPLPDNLKSSKTDTFDVTGPDGKTVIGTGTVDKGGQTVTVTLNEKVENLDDKVLDLYIATKYAGDEYGEQTVNFPNNHDDTINIVENTANLSKKGELQDNNTIKWTVLVNRQELEMANLKIHDTIGDNQTMVPGVTVSKAVWTSTTGYKREKPALSADKYQVSYTDDGFDLTFNDTVTDMYTIDYYTTVDDPSVIADGYVFKNRAELTWGSGSSGSREPEVANGKVSTTGSNSGNGNGTITGNEDQDGDGDIDENGDIDVDGDPDTGTVDTDEGTEDAVTTPTTPTKKQPAKRTTKQPTTTTKKQAVKGTSTTGTASHHVRPVVVTQGPTRVLHSANAKLPQTNEQTTSWATIGIGLLMGSGLWALIRRRP